MLPIQHDLLMDVCGMSTQHCERGLWSGLAQLVERWTLDREVSSSIPGSGEGIFLLELNCVKAP